MIVLLALLAGCTETGLRPGTSVGNPAKLAASVAPGSDVTLDSATLDVTSTRAVDCAGAGVDVPLAGVLDLFAPQQVQLDAGTWCRLDLSTAGLVATGTGPAGEHVRVELTVEEFDVRAPLGFVADDRSFVLEIGEPGWIDAADLGLIGDDVVVGADDPAHDALLEVVKKRSALWQDANDDAAVSDEERASGPRAAGEDREAEVEDHDDGDTDD